MIVPERWLRSFCDPAIDAEALAHELTMAGIEVESCTPFAPPSAGVVVAQVLAVEKTPASGQADGVQRGRRQRTGSSCLRCAETCAPG
jgi:hypothetical protein